ncbi:MAG: guanylate kinase [Syntrophotaleaceae bacterium]
MDEKWREIERRRTGILFVISAPSGAGKTSLCHEIIDIFPRIRHSVSYTTRPPRAGERNGVDYHFVAPDIFARMITEGAFVEWAEVHGNRYGTARETLDRSREAGYDVLLDIDCQGAAQLKKTCPEGVFIFILPPDFAELERRLRGRNTDASEAIEKRLQNARREIREMVWYDYLVINDDFDRASRELQAILTAEGCRTGLLKDKMLKIFGM